MNTRVDSAHRGGCANKRCACNDASRWPICAEFQATSSKTKFCMRCGWNRDHHDYLRVVAMAIVEDL